MSQPQPGERVLLVTTEGVAAETVERYITNLRAAVGTTGFVALEHLSRLSVG